MKLTRVHILHYRSCKDLELTLTDLHALVGANNSGKSNVLRALDFLFNPTTKSLSEESFWNKDTKKEIRVEAVFSRLNKKEEEQLKPYLLPSGEFVMARVARLADSNEEPGEESARGEAKYEITQQYKSLVPEPVWLQMDKVKGESIEEWWQTKDQLAIGGTQFLEGVTKKPKVSEWKELARQFVEANRDTIPFKESWIDNPAGYANVLKSLLPFFVLVPAVRDVVDEFKGTKSSPFGRLLSVIVQTVPVDKKRAIEDMLSGLARQMNRIGGAERVPSIAETEKELNRLLKDLFEGADLEIEFDTPTIETMLGSPKIYVDDGFRNSAENKGHGLQRAIIFSILRRYAEQMTSSGGEYKRTLLLAVEEPELYMHPLAQRTIRRVFRKMAGSGDQILFSTHSALLVDVAYFDEIIRMESVTTRRDGIRLVESKGSQLPVQRMIDDIVSRFPGLKGKVTEASIRDLYSNAYNPRRNEGFFASKVILVEGATEEYSLPIYAECDPTTELDARGISIIECGGKGQMDRLYRIFNELRIPCYLLFDYDKESKVKNTIDKSKDLLRLVGAGEVAPDRMYIGDQAAFFPEKWEVQLRAEIPKIDELTKEARAELGIGEENNGKPLIARYIARKLTSGTPPYVPPTIRQIFERATNAKWTQSCLK